MLSDFKKHKLAYLGLLMMIGAFIGSFLYFWPDRQILKMLVITFVAMYFIWGVLVHKISGHINREIIKEYALVALVGGVMLLMLIH